MYHISDQQMDYILGDIRARGIGMEDLQQNILDHICCIIEQNLEEGGDFETFYSTTIQTFYHRELREIEEETRLLLTFKNYYNMKKALIISGIILTISFFAGSILKIMHLPGASMLLFLGILAMSLIFLPLLFIIMVKSVKSRRDLWVGGIGTVTGILFFISTLFLVMHWPGARVLWLGTLLLSSVVFIPLYFFSGIRQPETRLNTIISSIILVAATNALFILTNIRTAEKKEIHTSVSMERPGNVKEISNPKIADR